ncbi:MAG: hypothetical protein WBQ95_15285 [Terracidiphilus sp.]
MRLQQPFTVAALALGLGMTVSGQSSPVAADSSAQAASEVVPAPLIAGDAPALAPSPAVRILEDFKPADVKFDVNELADILRDRRHEGWVLAAYPDPKTGQPLIGAGFSLDLPAREHPQPDPLNPHPFLEPSSADLWQAAGFDPARLDGILRVFYERRREWSKRTWRRQMMSLPEQISDDEAIQLVRVGAIQAIYNARAYCRNFDQMTGPQQMAMAQLVYQMGVNLEHFSSFLALVNPGEGPRAEAVGLTETAPDAPMALDQTPEYWTGVQKSLMTTQWARLYRTRAISVIAMLDPTYMDDPSGAERRVGATLRPAVAHRRGRHAVATREVAATTTHRGHTKAGHTSARAKSRKRA